MRLRMQPVKKRIAHEKRPAGVKLLPAGMAKGRKKRPFDLPEGQIFAAMRRAI